MRITAPAKTETRQERSLMSDKQSALGAESESSFIDNRPQAIAQRQLQAIPGNSPTGRRHTMLRQMAQAGRPLQAKAAAPKLNGAVLQKNEDENAEEAESASEQSEQSDDSEAPLQLHKAQGRVKPILQMKTGMPVQLAPFKPASAPRTTKTAENPDTWNGKNAFSLISSNIATYPTAARTRTSDAKGGESDTSGLKPDGMEKWYQKGLLQDPSVQGKAQALTKMHAINSHLYGPNQETNIFLGSANANAQHSDEVEEPIKRYVKKAGHAVDYHVAVAYGNPGWVNGAAYGKLSKSEKKEFNAWRGQAIAHHVTCTATYYEKMGGVWMASTPESHVINALTTAHKKIGGYSKPKKIKEFAAKRSLAKARRMPLFGAVKKALHGKKKGITVAAAANYIGTKKLGTWKDKGIANMLEYMRNQGLVAIINSKYVASKKL